MGKRKYLTDPEIMSIAGLSPDEMRERIGELGPEGVKDLIVRLVASYRLAAKVANAAWGFWQTWEKGTGPIADHEIQLNRTLQDYAPTDFPKHQGEIEALVEELKSLHEEVDGFSADECRDAIKARFEMLEIELRKMQGKPAVPRTPA